MQIVIDIPDDLYYEIQAYKTIFDEHNSELATVINDGKLLLKGHGRLIDADELYGDFIDGTEGYDCQTWNRIEIGDIIENVPTIIEGSEE